MDEENYTVEDRVYRCPHKLCSNILHIQVHICKNSEAATYGPTFDAGEVRYVTAIDEDKLFGERRGCCISHATPDLGRRRRGHIWWRRMFTYGPVQANRITFVHCKCCYTRVGWKKFKKVVV